MNWQLDTNLRDEVLIDDHNHMFVDKQNIFMAAMHPKRPESRSIKIAEFNNGNCLRKNYVNVCDEHKMFHQNIELSVHTTLVHYQFLERKKTTKMKKREEVWSEMRTARCVFYAISVDELLQLYKMQIQKRSAKVTHSKDEDMLLKKCAKVSGNEKHQFLAFYDGSMFTQPQIVHKSTDKSIADFLAMKIIFSPSFFVSRSLIRATHIAGWPENVGENVCTEQNTHILNALLNCANKAFLSFATQCFFKKTIDKLQDKTIHFKQPKTIFEIIEMVGDDVTQNVREQLACFGKKLKNAAVRNRVPDNLDSRDKKPVVWYLKTSPRNDALSSFAWDQKLAMQDLSQMLFAYYNSSLAYDLLDTCQTAQSQYIVPKRWRHVRDHAVRNDWKTHKDGSWLRIDSWMYNFKHKQKEDIKRQISEMSP